jgi:hypothetical protein
VRPTTRVMVVTGLSLFTLAAVASPAAADPARPGNVRSEVLSVQPPTNDVTLAVVGGDAFLHLEVERGHEVAVPGYQGEPYLRVRSDGTVEENLASEATYLNRSRFARVTVPPDAGPDKPTRWHVVGHGGSYTWHDHRVHWMGGGEPVQQVTPWQVPIVVDGHTVTFDGQYVRVDPPASWPWWLVAAALAVGSAAIGSSTGVPRLDDSPPSPSSPWWRGSSHCRSRGRRRHRPAVLVHPRGAGWR